MRKARVDWCYCHDASSATPYRIFCTRCGGYHDPQLPVEIGEFCRQVGAFQALHEHCKQIEVIR